MGIADIHMHTIYSYDGTAAVSAVLERAVKVGLDIIAITDHDVIRGALEAEQMSSNFGIQVIPGIEITTSDGDLLALSVRKMIPAGLTLIETIKRVGDEGGFCVAPHPAAGGMGMKSLSAYNIFQALDDVEAARILIGIETYNATTLDREANKAAAKWVKRIGIAQTGSSDAHVLGAIGLGATEFPGKSIDDFYKSLCEGTTIVRKGIEWGPIEVLGKWAANYIKSTPAHLALVFG
ncbi:MAG: PHP domain-containing protein [Chloroflexota bacterium]